jgi:ABC-type Fe3+-siderophore transport system permease subunit
MIAEIVVIIIISFLCGCVIGAANLSMTKIESIENYYNANNANKKRKNTKSKNKKRKIQKILTLPYTLAIISSYIIVTTCLKAPTCPPQPLKVLQIQ